MLINFLKRIIPDPEVLKQHKAFDRFGHLFQHPNLFYLNRRSVCRAVFIGLFVAFLPIPTQMLAAAFWALLARANLPIAVSLVWVSNPATIPFLLVFCYYVGAYSLGMPDIYHQLSWSLDSFYTLIGDIWQPVLLGCLIVGISSASIGYLVVKTLWLLGTLMKRKHRQRRQSK